MCRISAISDDWATKGCHVHVGSIEVALRPDHLGGIVFRSVFSGTDASDLDAAARLIEQRLADPEWRNGLSSTVQRAMKHIMGIEGALHARARGSLRELRMLVVALDRMGQE